MNSIQYDSIRTGFFSTGIYQAVMMASAGLVVAAIWLQPAYATDECSPTNTAAAKSASVPVGDLDLSTTEGIRAAKQRIHQAARKLCEQVVDSHSISHQPDFVRCVDATMAAAAAKLEGPFLARSDGTPLKNSGTR
jgi:UrcA family protein